MCRPLPGASGCWKASMELASWRCTGWPPGATLTGPDPSNGGGQFWVVAAGTLSAAEFAVARGQFLHVFVAPSDTALDAIAGPGGAEALCPPLAARRTRRGIDAGRA